MSIANAELKYRVISALVRPMSKDSETPNHSRAVHDQYSRIDGWLSTVEYWLVCINNSKKLAGWRVDSCMIILHTGLPYPIYALCL